MNFQTQKPDFAAMTGPALVAQYNEMVLTAVDLGLGYMYTTTKRFGDRGAGIMRCEKLHKDITEALAKRAAPGPQTVSEHTIKLSELKGGEHLAEAVAAATENPAPAGETAAPAASTAETANSESEDEMGKRRQKATAGRKGSGRGKSTSGGTIREMTEEYNSIVKGLSAAVKKENPWAKHHTSNFESVEKAKKQLARLKKIA